MESSQAIKSFTDASVVRPLRTAARPTTREYIRHICLFLLTAVTTTFTGVMLLSTNVREPSMPAVASWFDYLLFIPLFYFKMAAAYATHALAEPALLLQGLAFSVSLLAILTAHEFGHYIACRLYGVDSTLPFFIPSPPLIGIGTFGAFIKIKSPIPSRRALFDIGVAGPLAGFVMLIPIVILGIVTSHTGPTYAPGEATYFNDPLLTRIIARVVGVDVSLIAANPFQMAGWVGLLVTSLNLLPVGQLDGGHAIYAVFGKRVHRVLGPVAFAAMATLSVLGWVWHRSPSGFLYTVLLAIMLRVRHPQTEEFEPLGRARNVIALITLLVFVLSFWPFPITFG
jgi:membrane-associated protease RseP (regulator of RpoE activity)